MSPLSRSTALTLAAACGRDVDPPGFTSSPPPAPTLAEHSSSDGSSSSNADPVDESSTSTSADASTGTAESSTTTSPSTGHPPDFPIDPPGCQGKIDFLFNIESWYSVKVMQDQMKEAFPTFIDILNNELDEFDYHIMVLDSAGIARLPDCWQCYSCTGCTGPGCTDFGGPADYPCMGPWDFCDSVPGAGVTMPANFEASNKRCELATDNRYLTTADAPDLLEKFECIATVGQGPKTPVPMQTMMKALDPENPAGACNAGFLRDDALLVVVVLNGTHDDVSAGWPEKWYEAVVEAKHGNEAAAVILVVSNDTDLPDAVCPGGPSGPNPLREFAELADHGLFEPACVDSYVPLLEQGADMILEQCSLLVPR
jgi:hypothetical protein